MPVGVIRDRVETKRVSRNSLAFTYKIENNTISFSHNEIKKIIIADVQGRVLFSKEVLQNESHISIPNNAVGYRLISLVSHDGIVQTIPWVSGSGVSNSRKKYEHSVRSKQNVMDEKQDFPDTLKVNATGYPELIIPINLDSSAAPFSAVMIDISRGKALSNSVIMRTSSFSGDLGLDTIAKNQPEGIFEYTGNIAYEYRFILQSINAYSTILKSAKVKNKTFTLNNKNWVYIDGDTVEGNSTTLFGTLFDETVTKEPLQTWASYDLCYFQKYPVKLYKSDSTTLVGTTYTDSLGRYSFSPPTLGKYVIKIPTLDSMAELGDRPDTMYFRYNGAMYNVDTENNRRADHIGKYTVDNGKLSVAPNIYLYPEQKSTIDVKVNILANGTIPFSIPTYNGGWKVTATPEGKINDSLGFLYYDFFSSIPYQSDSGWVLNYATFDAEVTTLLTQRGLNKQEIWDFIDFWKKYIPVCDWVTLCPINADRMVELTVKPTPMTLFRELYLVLPSKGERPTIKEPSRGTPFVRIGFTVVEWGGHLEGLTLDEVIADKKK